MKPSHAVTLRAAARVVLTAFTDRDLRIVSKPAVRALWLLSLAYRRPSHVRLAFAPKRQSVPTHK